MRFPNDRRYTSDHEWAKLEGKVITIGITDHAQGSLGDVVYVELPAVGKELKAGASFGTVESIKAVSDLYAPLDCRVVEVNSALASDPSVINRSPHTDAWMIRVESASGALPENLLDADAYTKLVASL